MADTTVAPARVDFSSLLPMELLVEIAKFISYPWTEQIPGPTPEQTQQDFVNLCLVNRNLAWVARPMLLQEPIVHRS
jgi:hypothetical protein